MRGRPRPPLRGGPPMLGKPGKPGKPPAPPSDEMPGSLPGEPPPPKLPSGANRVGLRGAPPGIPPRCKFSCSGGNALYPPSSARTSLTRNTLYLRSGERMRTRVGWGRGEVLLVGCLHRPPCNRLWSAPARRAEGRRPNGGQGRWGARGFWWRGRLAGALVFARFLLQAPLPAHLFPRLRRAIHTLDLYRGILFLWAQSFERPARLHRIRRSLSIATPSTWRAV